MVLVALQTPEGEPTPNHSHSFWVAVKELKLSYHDGYI